ncbi:DUF1465 family protein [Sphingomonas abaci]|uniref:Regulator of CtrA degradation n=1 Tax=Sphingomonas abaci TaxID=237611 RepID=A0A7W7AKX1_9SPHN|nr:DUF1465 family protein [Sphingomonas abaci]MBB4618940.1 regulator of CtrA degradation [Sphingomonas abaci]
MQRGMIGSMTPAGIQTRLVNALYTDAMLLADEARSYFDDRSRQDRDTLPPVARVAFSCESLKVTTRLMHVIAWLLVRRAVAAGELTPMEALTPNRRLSDEIASEDAVLSGLPDEARHLVEASQALFRRAAALDRALAGDAEMAAAAGAASPVRAMQHDLLARLGRGGVAA